MKKIFNICNAYIAVWCVYWLQGFLYSRDTPIAKYLLLTNLILSIYFASKVLMQRDLPSYFKAANILLLMFLVYWMILMQKGQEYYVSSSLESVDKWAFYKSILISFLPIYAGYYFASRNLLTEKTLKTWIVIFFVVATALFYQNKVELIAHAMEIGSNKEEFTNNGGYLFVSLFPSLALFNKQIKYQYAGFAYSMLFLLLGMKRGAILIGGIVLLYYTWYTFRHVGSQKRLVLIMLTILTVILGIYFFDKMLATSVLFNERLAKTMDGYMSSRDIIAKDIIHYLQTKASLLNYAIGAGAYSTLNITVNFAHNDWLEIICCEGLLGVFIYMHYWRTFYRYTTVIRKDIPEYVVIRLFFMIFLLKTLFSMSYNDMPIFATIPFGYCLYHSYKATKYKNVKI